MTVLVTIAQSDRVLALASEPASFLFEEETKRLASYGHEQAATDFLAGRVLIRSLLRKRTACPISAFRFHIASSRKPVLEDTRLGHFNLSHKRGWVAAAVAEHPIGIDIETAEGVDWRRVARRMFQASEAERLAALPDEEGRFAFCRSWSYKEALIKALARNLDPLPELLDPATPAWRPAPATLQGVFTFAVPLPHGAGHLAIAAPRPETAPQLLSVESVMTA